MSTRLQKNVHEYEYENIFESLSPVKIKRGWWVIDHENIYAFIFSTTRQRSIVFSHKLPVSMLRKLLNHVLLLMRQMLE